MSVIAFSIVFILITFIMLSMMALHKACYAHEKKKQSAIISAKVEPVVSVQNESSDDELIAVLTAAVMQFASAGAKIVSFKPSVVHAPKRSLRSNLNRIQNFENQIKR